MTLNYAKGGTSWKEHGVYKKQVEKRNLNTAETSEQLAEFISTLINNAAEKGFLKF